MPIFDNYAPVVIQALQTCVASCGDSLPHVQEEPVGRSVKCRSKRPELMVEISMHRSNSPRHQHANGRDDLLPQSVELILPLARAPVRLYQQPGPARQSGGPKPLPLKPTPHPAIPISNRRTPGSRACRYFVATMRLAEEEGVEGIELGPHALRSGKRVAIPIRNDRCRGILNEMILALEPAKLRIFR